MKVIDFWAGFSVNVLNNWSQPDSWWGVFVRQSFITTILDWIPNEVHCYDRINISERETEETFMGDVGKIILHANQRKLPRRVDMICAFNPDPVSIFGWQVGYSYPKSKQVQYLHYVSSLAHMVDVRLRIGGILAIQYDECVKPPIDVPYDATRIFLAKILSRARSGMEEIYHSDSCLEMGEVLPFKGAYSFSSLHIYKKIHNIPEK